PDPAIRANYPTSCTRPRAHDAFAQAEARRAMEAERVRAEAEQKRVAEEQLLKEQNRERNVMRQRSQSQGHER
ncbi:MAG: hypothetical protein ACLPSW_24365, partial [Roseiarcus sp.]